MQLAEPATQDPGSSNEENLAAAALFFELPESPTTCRESEPKMLSPGNETKNLRTASQARKQDLHNMDRDPHPILGWAL